MWYRNVKWFGLILVVIGILVGLNRLEVLTLERHWLTLIIIIPCLLDMVVKKINRVNAIGLGVGCVVFSVRQFAISVAVILPILLIVIGLVFVFIPTRKGIVGNDESKVCS